MFIQTLAGVLAAQLDIEVRYSDSASTFSISRRADGRLVLTMATRILEANHECEEAMGNLFRGALAHEALGHGYHTDFSDGALAKGGTYALSLANLIEDIRIEAAAPKRFLGAKHFLSEMARVIDCELHFWPAHTEPERWQQNLASALLRKYRTELLHQPLDQEVTRLAVETARRTLGDELFAKVDSIARRGCLSASTVETSAAADEIVALLKVEDQKPHQERPGRKDDGTQGDQSGASNSNTHGDQSGASNSDTAGDQNGQADHRTERGARSDGGAPSARTAFDPSASADTDVESAIGKTVEASNEFVHRTGDSCTGYVDMTKSVWDRTGDASSIPSSRLASRITANLERALCSVTDDSDDAEVETGLRLDLGRLPVIAAGLTPTPFVEDGCPGAGINTEVMLVLDASQSMDGLSRSFMRALVRDTMLAMAKFAPDVGLSVAFFDIKSLLFVEPGKHISPSLAAAVAGQYVPAGGTRWSQSITPLVPLLAASRRRRKVLLTVTDGLIDSVVDSPLMADIKHHAIECRFVSIGHELPRGFDGIVCEQNETSFAEALCNTLLASVPPEFA